MLNREVASSSSSSSRHGQKHLKSPTAPLGTPEKQTGEGEAWRTGQAARRTRRTPGLCGQEVPAGAEQAPEPTARRQKSLRAVHQDLPEAACTTGRVRRWLGRVISPSASQPVLVINFRFRSLR